MANPRSRPWQGRTSQGSLGDAGAYTAAQWAETWKTMIGTGANYANRGVVRGVDSEFEVTPNSPAAQNVLVETGAALVQGRWVYYDEITTVSVASNASGSTRIDMIVLEADYTAQTVRIDIVQGTPAAGIPALTQNLGIIWQIPLAYLTLASGFTTITASMITDLREYANIPDAIGYIATNNSGGALENGAVVIASGTQGFTTSSSPIQQAAGVLEARTANGAVGRIITQGIISVIVNASASVGDRIAVGTTLGQGAVNTLKPFALVIVANTGAGTRALCYVNVPIDQPPFDSGWFAVNNNVTYNQAHGLGVIPSRIDLYWGAIAAPTTYVRVHTVMIAASGVRGVYLAANATNVVAITGADATSGTLLSNLTNSAAGYYRLLAWR